MLLLETGKVGGSGRFGVNFRSSVCDLLRWSCSLAIQVEMWQGRQLDQLESGRGAARAGGGYLQSTVLCFVQTRSADEVLSKGLPTWLQGPESNTEAAAAQLLATRIGGQGAPGPTTESRAPRGAGEALPALLPRGRRGFWEVLPTELVSESWQTEMGRTLREGRCSGFRARREAGGGRPKGAGGAGLCGWVREPDPQLQSRLWDAGQEA